MAYVKKFKSGGKFDCLQEFINWALYSQKPVMWMGKYKHPSIVLNMTFHVVLRAVERGTISKAISTEEK